MGSVGGRHVQPAGTPLTGLILGLTQEQLAQRMGTSYSAISRIESGQHNTSVQTLQRLAAALEMRFVMGFEHGPEDKPVRQLVPA